LRPTLILVLFVAAANPAAAQLHEIETKDLRLLFYDGRHTYLAPQLMRAFENAFEFCLFEHPKLGPGSWTTRRCIGLSVTHFLL